MPRILSRYLVAVSVELPANVPTDDLAAVAGVMSKDISRALDAAFVVKMDLAERTIEVLFHTLDSNPQELVVARERAVQAINLAYRNHYLKPLKH